jgi:hypothetical protein
MGNKLGVLPYTGCEPGTAKYDTGGCVLYAVESKIPIAHRDAGGKKECTGCMFV